MPMNVRPDYDGHYDVDTDAGMVDATFEKGAWTGNIGAYRQWRGRRTVLLKSEADRLKQTLAKHGDSPAYRREAWEAALQLARAAQERAARTGKHAALRTACRYFHIAVGLNAEMRQRDEEFMSEWWTRFKDAPKRKVEAEVRAFLNGQSVQFK
jgi:hypothetical protein